MIIATISCRNEKKENRSTLSTSENLEKYDGYVQTTKDSLNSIIDRICTVIHYEFVDLYKDTDSIPEADFMELDNYLKNEGFEVVETGRGNWMKGPRILSMTLRKGSCYCRIDKLYYSLENCDKKYKVTERIETIKR